MKNRTTSTHQQIYHQSLLFQIASDLDHQVAVKDYLLQLDGSGQPLIHWLNPDLKPLTVEVVRELISQLSLSVSPNETRYVAIAKIDQASLPAQNALLKSLEEPPQQTQLVLTTDEPDRVLPTIRSRCQLIKLSTIDETDQPTEVAELYETITTSNYGYLVEIAQEYKDRSAALAIVNDLLHYVHNLSSGKNPNNQNRLSSQKTHQHAKQLLKTLAYLKANCNPQLALENCFFAMRNGGK